MSAQTFPTLTAAVTEARYHGLRSLSSAIISEPREGQRDGYIVQTTATIGDGHWVTFGSAATLEAAESRSIARVISLALGVSVGQNGTPA